MARRFFSLAPLGDPLTRRIFAYLTLPVLVIGVAFNVAYLYQEIAANTREFEENAKTEVDLFARSARIAVFSLDTRTIEILADSLLRHENYHVVTVFDDLRVPVVRVRIPGDARLPGEPDPIPELWGGLRVGEVTAIDRQDHVEFWTPVQAGRNFQREQDLYFDASPPVSQQPPIGFVRLTASKEGIRAAVYRDVRRNAILTLLFVVVGGVVAFVVVSQVNRPLRDLLAHTRQHAVSGTGEDLRGLSSRFGALVSELDVAFETIQRFNDELESRVVERTRELGEANVSLRDEVRQRLAAQQELQRAHDHLEEKVRERTTELGHTHAQLRHAEKLSAIGRLAASLAHEFNNPICGVRNCIEELRHELPPGGEGAEIAELALRECERMAGLTGSLRQLSRPSVEEVGLVDVHSCLQAMARLTRKEFDRARIRMVVECQPKLPPVRASADQLRQVCLNLLQNACDAMDGVGGTVTLGARAEAGQVAISVRDEGSGITEAHLPRLFEPFFSTKSAVKGTGLGLSVSHGIVERFGGRIEVETSTGLGSTFTVWLPAVEEGA